MLHVGEGGQCGGNGGGGALSSKYIISKTITEAAANRRRETMITVPKNVFNTSRGGSHFCQRP